MVLNGFSRFEMVANFFLHGSNDLRWVYMVLDGFKWFKITLDPFSLFSGVHIGFSLC